MACLWLSLSLSSPLSPSAWYSSLLSPVDSTMPWVAVFTCLACRSVGLDIACQVFSWAALSSRRVIAPSWLPGAGRAAIRRLGRGSRADINPVKHTADSLLTAHHLTLNTHNNMGSFHGSRPHLKAKVKTNTDALGGNIESSTC